jgi:hypothetical protein
VWYGQMEMPVHHTIEEYLDRYIEVAGSPQNPKAPYSGHQTARRGSCRSGRLTAMRLRDGAAAGKAAGIQTKLGCHTFRATGITIYLTHGGDLKAQQMAAYESRDLPVPGSAMMATTCPCPARASASACLLCSSSRSRRRTWSSHVAQIAESAFAAYLALLLRYTNCLADTLHRHPTKMAQLEVALGQPARMFANCYLARRRYFWSSNREQSDLHRLFSGAPIAIRAPAGPLLRIRRR